MRRAELAGPYLVLGCARAGSGAAAAIARRCGPETVSVWDELDLPATHAWRDTLATEGVTVTLGPWDERLLHGVRTVVKSPGVPAEHAAVSGALTRGLTVRDELEVGIRGASDRILATVTGTDGKSTTCGLVAAAVGHPGNPALVAGNTQFGPALSAVASGPGGIVVEASSYQLQFAEGPFSQVAVLTNITPEHLHRHGTLSRYAEAKARAFLVDGHAVGRAVLPVGDLFAVRLASDLRAHGAAVATFGQDRDADYRLLEARPMGMGTRLTLTTPLGTVRITSRLPGRHNALNLAAALAASDLLGVDRGHTLEAFAETDGLPGRWERVDDGGDIAVVVDFAHTPAGLRAVLRTARELVDPESRIHLVLSSGGGNDAGYRSELGAIAAELADRTVVTEGNGRGEPRERVIAAIRAGALGLEAIADRREAIAEAIRGARRGDLVLIVDRGAMGRLLTDRAGGGPAFDDRVVAREILAEIAGEPDTPPVGALNLS